MAELLQPPEPEERFVVVTPATSASLEMWRGVLGRDEKGRDYSKYAGMSPKAIARKLAVERGEKIE